MIRIHIFLFLLLLPLVTHGRTTQRLDLEARSERRASRNCGLPLQSLGFPEELLGQNCFEDRNKDLPSDVETDYLASDQDVCECLGGNPLNLELIKKKMTFEERHIANQVAMYEINVLEKQQRFQNLNDGMMIQSWIVSGDKGLTTAYMQPLEKDEEKAALDSYLLESRKALIAEGENKLFDADPEIKRKYSGRILDVSKKITGPEVLANPYPSTEVNPPSCFSMQSYLAFQQFPTDKTFYSDLKIMTEYRPEDWDLASIEEEYNEVALKYDRALRSSSPEGEVLKKKVDSFKARLVFLKKNPLLANLFGAPDPAGKEGALLKERKRDLFKLIKGNFVVKDGCETRDNACLTHLQKNLEAYEKGVKELFKKDEVFNAARAQSQAMLTREYREHERLKDARLPRTQKAMEAKLELMTGSSIRECNAETKGLNVATCIENFANYCMLIQNAPTSDSEITDVTYIRPAETLAAEMVFDFSIDPKKNPGFQKLSKELCETPRPNKKNPKEHMTFASFKKSYCSAAANKATCSSSDRLLVTFLDRFGDANDPIAGVMAEVVHAHPDSQKMTDADVVKSRKMAKSYSEVKKLGGSKFLQDIGRKIGGESVGPAETAASREEKIPAPAQATRELPARTPASEEMAQASLIQPAMSAPAPTIPAANPGPVPEAESAAARAERESLEEELQAARKELSDAREARERATMREMENRIKQLEGMIAASDRNIQAAATKKERKTPVEEESKVSAVKESTPQTEEKVSKPRSARAPASDDFKAHQPAVLPESHFASAMSAGRSANTASAAASISPPGSGKVKSGSGYINAALLDRYNITLTSDVVGTAHLAREKEQKVLDLLSRSQDGPVVPVVVSASDYNRFQNNDLRSLKQLYEEKAQGLSASVVKLAVRLEGQESRLEFYAIKDGENVIFQPVRKSRLTDLQSVLPKTE